MTYVFDGRQHIAVAAGPTIIAFAIVDDGKLSGPSESTRPISPGA